MVFLQDLLYIASFSYNSHSSLSWILDMAGMQHTEWFWIESILDESGNAQTLEDTTVGACDFSMKSPVRGYLKMSSLQELFMVDCDAVCDHHRLKIIKADNVFPRYTTVFDIVSRSYFSNNRQYWYAYIGKVIRLFNALEFVVRYSSQSLVGLLQQFDVEQVSLTRCSHTNILSKQNHHT